jgi:hypothetical protein
MRINLPISDVFNTSKIESTTRWFTIIIIIFGLLGDIEVSVFWTVFRLSSETFDAEVLKSSAKLTGDFYRPSNFLMKSTALYFFVFINTTLTGRVDSQTVF